MWLKFATVGDLRAPLQALDDLTCVMTYYNESAFFRPALDSALRNVDARRILVIDDCSRPEESEAARLACAQCGVAYQRLSVNCGLSGARMAGLQRVTTPYVMFLDSDDIIDDGYAARLMASLQPEMAFAMGVQRFFSETPGDDPRCWPTESKDWRACVDEPCLCGAGVIHRVELLRTLGGFRLRWGGRFEDWDLGLRMVQHGCRGVSVRDASYWYRRRPGTLTTQISPARRAAIDLAICVDYRELVRSITTDQEFLSRRFFPLLFESIRRADRRSIRMLFVESRHLLGVSGLLSAVRLIPDALRWLRRKR